MVIWEYYLLIFSEGELLEIVIGVVLVLVDKFDSVFLFFLVGMILIGFNDFYVFCC